MQKFAEVAAKLIPQWEISSSPAHFKSSRDVDILEDLSQDEMLVLRRTFQKRHVHVHNGENYSRASAGLRAVRRHFPNSGLGARSRSQNLRHGGERIGADSAALVAAEPGEGGHANGRSWQRGQGLPTVACSGRRPAHLRDFTLRWGTSVCNPERRLVDQNVASWNQITDWLKQIEWLHSKC